MMKLTALFPLIMVICVIYKPVNATCYFNMFGELLHYVYMRNYFGWKGILASNYTKSVSFLSRRWKAMSLFWIVWWILQKYFTCWKEF